MAKKYYAVHQGRVPGVYTSWTECEAQVKGYGGAKYKSFPTREEALAFVNMGNHHSGNFSEKDSSIQSKKKTTMHEKIKGVHTPIRQDTCHMFAYIDGSFEKRLQAVGYGGIIVYDGKEIPFSYGTKDAFYTAYWNISGELLAARTVMNFAVQHGIKSCAIYYDCQGIEMWATGKWKTNNPLTKDYAAYAQKVQEIVHLEFYKVAAHTGIKYNEMADRLAKEGLTKA